MTKSKFCTLFWTPAFAMLLVGLDQSLAQSPGTPIEAASSTGNDPALVAQATGLRKAGKLLDRRKWEAMLRAPTPAALELPPAASGILTPREIAERARKGAVHVGWFYQCEHCDLWHLNMAGGYAVTADGAVATCAHCVEADRSMRQSYLVAMDSERHILPVTALLARSQTMDTVIIRVGSANLTPLALNDQVGPGDPAYLLSDPLDVSGYFSTGNVNRFFWAKNQANDATTLQGVRQLRLHVSTDWAPGSSGAAVLDQCGNAIGHVDSISPMSESDPDPQRGNRSMKPKDQGEDRFHGVPLITLHEAIPARGVMLLAKSMDANPPGATPKSHVSALQSEEQLDEMREALEVEEEGEIADALQRFDRLAAGFRTQFLGEPARWALPVLEVAADELRDTLHKRRKITDPAAHLLAVVEAASASAESKAQASNHLLLIKANQILLDSGAGAEAVPAWETRLVAHTREYPADPESAPLRTMHMELLVQVAPTRAEALARELCADPDQEVAEAAKTHVDSFEHQRTLASQPFALAFSGIDGRKVDVAKWRGKVVLVDFWASWSDPSMQERPHVLKAYERFKARGLEIAGISLDETRHKLQATLKSRRMTWPQRFTGKGWEDPLIKELKIEALPALWLVNKRGYIVDFAACKDLEKKIETLLGE